MVLLKTMELKEKFSDLKSDTDSEIIAHLIQKKLSEKNNLLEAVLAVSQNYKVPML